MLNYFGVSQNYLVARKHNKPWRRKYFRLSDIREIVFENNNAIYDQFKVVTHNFKTYFYTAPTLPYKTWFPLKDELERRGVKVVNASINPYYME